MFRRDFLKLVRVRPTDDAGLSLADTDGEHLDSTEVRSSSGETYRIRDGYLDLLGRRPVADNPANLSNYLPGAGGLYEPLWRVRSLSLLTGGDYFPNEREVEIISRMAEITDGGIFLDLGCSAGLYTRSFAPTLDGRIIGLDISPSMLKEAVRKAGSSLPVEARPSFVRADAKSLPFADGVFDGAVCGGSLNEFGDPALVLRETARVTRSGGRVAIMGILRAATANGLRLQKFLSTGGIKFFAEDEITSILDHAGFEPDEMTTFGPVFFAGGTRR